MKRLHGHGFILGGHDRHLYSPLPGIHNETALYWYLFLDKKGLQGQ